MKGSLLPNGEMKSLAFVQSGQILSGRVILLTLNFKDVSYISQQLLMSIREKLSVGISQPGMIRNLCSAHSSMQLSVQEQHRSICIQIKDRNMMQKHTRSMC